MSYRSKNTQLILSIKAALVLLFFTCACSKTPFDLTHAPQRGSGSGDILVQFTDFDCQSCKAVQPSLHALRISHPQVVLAFKSFPLVDSEAGIRKHLIARCVFEQDKESFWLYYDLAFSDNPGPAADDRQTAEMMNLDSQAMAQCIASPTTRQAVLRDQQEGQTSGVVGTPTFFFKGSRKEGLMSAKDMRQFVANLE